MKQQHTPGPWKTAKRIKRGEFVTETHIFASDSSHIAEVRPCQIEENARLIAAAPDLLKALKGTMRTMQMMHGADCRCVECIDARSAIQKAEGTE